VTDKWIDPALRREANFNISSITIPGAGGIGFDPKQTNTLAWLKMVTNRKKVDLSYPQVIDTILNDDEKRRKTSSLYKELPDGSLRSYLNLKLTDIAAATKYCIIEGGPGSGKTTFLKYIAMCMIGERLALEERPFSIKHMSSWIHG